MPDMFDINSLFNQNKDPYSASALINDGMIDPSSSIVTGDRTKGLFSTGENELGKMDFLKLLTTQLQYQDPFEPMDNTEFVAQLAQFSALEGTNNVENAISGLDQSFKESLDVQSFSALSMTNASAVSLIGKEVRIAETTVKYTGIAGEEPTIQVHLGNSDTANVQILNRDGEVVKTLLAENKDAENSVTLTWDGKDDTGNYVQSGTYHLYVEGQEADPSLYCFVESLVEGVRYTGDGPMIKIGGKELPIGNILDISMSGSSGNNGTSGLDTNTAISLIGKTIRYREPVLSYMPNPDPNQVQTKTLNIDLGGMEKAIIQVKDADGKVVNSFEVEAGPGGIAQVDVDCIDHNGNGPYNFSILGNSSAYFFSEGPVDGISTVDGIIKLRVNGITVSLSDILDISSDRYTV